MATMNFARLNFGKVWCLTLGVSFCCTFITHKGTAYGGVIKTHHDVENEECKSICSTRECMAIANNLFSNMDRTVDPCDDFYSFSCGGYMAKMENGSTATVIRTLEEDILQVAKDIIETYEETDLPDSASQKLKTVYHSCMDTGFSESAMKTIQEFLHGIGIPKWPHLDSNFTFINTTLEEILGRLISHNEDAFIRFGPKYEEEIPEIRIFNIDAPKSTYDTDTEIGKVKDLVTAILEDAGMNPEDIYQAWEEFVSLEEAIRKLDKESTQAGKDCADTDTTSGTILNCYHQHVKNESIFCKILDSVIRNGNLGSTFSRDEIFVYCVDEYYIKKLTGLLESYDHRALAHYISIRFFFKNTKYMDFTLRKRWNIIFNDENDIYSDNYVELDRWKFCISWIAKNMAIPLGFMYVSTKKYYLLEAGATVVEISDAIIKIIETQEWIRNETKTLLAQIVGKTELDHTELLKLLINETRIDEMYRNFHPTPDNFILNILRCKKFLFNAMTLKKDSEVMDRYNLMFGVGAFTWDFNDGKFKIELRFGFLLPPFYMNKAPKLFNAAGIGEILAHEFGHVVYMTLDFARKVDIMSRLAFRERRQCLIDQYSKYELKHIGKNDQSYFTITENFPDNMAIYVAEKIAEKFLRNMTEGMFALPGLPYSPEQLFYIHYAQPWCEVIGAEMEAQYSKSSYSPSRYRVTGVLQNSKRFSQVFNCTAESFMNPKKKCLVFD